MHSERWHYFLALSGIFPSGADSNFWQKFTDVQADFPTGEVLFGKQPEAYKKAWKTESYAWAHPDNGLEKEDKIKLLSEKFWKVVPEDPIPTCPK